MRFPLEIAKREDHQEFLRSYSACRDVRETIVDYLEKEIQRLVEDAEKKEYYSSPQWAHLHADNIGERRGLRRAVQLLIGDRDGRRSTKPNQD